MRHSRAGGVAVGHGESHHGRRRRVDEHAAGVLELGRVRVVLGGRLQAARLAPDGRAALRTRPRQHATVGAPETAPHGHWTRPPRTSHHLETLRWSYKGVNVVYITKASE